MIGAVLAGAKEEEIGKMEEIAGKIGLAFQIQDDILDVTSTTEILGKPVHSDEKNEKTTYVTWKGLEKAKEEAARLTEEAVEELRSIGKECGFMEELFQRRCMQSQMRNSKVRPLSKFPYLLRIRHESSSVLFDNHHYPWPEGHHEQENMYGSSR